MSELAAASAVVSALNSAFNLTKGFLEVQGTVKVQAKVIELQGQILSAQQSAMVAQQTQSELVEKVRGLEAELQRLSRWELDRDSFQLQNVGSGSFVYSPKSEPTPDQPNYWLCVNCFEGGRRSVLQNQGRAAQEQAMKFACPTCKTGFLTHYRNGPHRRGEEMMDGSKHP